MPRNYQPVELNTFVGGLITEASPLTFPQNASLDEVNFVLNKNGSRSRRLGMDLEDSYVTRDYNLPTDSSRLITNSFKWDNAGGIASKSIIVVQIGGKVDFFDGDSVPLSSGLLYSADYGGSGVSRLSFTSVDGKLVVTTGKKDVDVFLYDETTKTITKTSNRLMIRDLFGLEDIVGGVNYKAGTNVSLRPTTLTGIHNYNLRNQTWAVPRPLYGGDDNPRDVINWFHVHAGGKYPSNADSTIPYIYAQTDSSLGGKSVLRFDGNNSAVNAPDTTPAPIGYFIIDALDRGKSRFDELIKLGNKYASSQELIIDPGSIPTDSSPSGAACVCEYGGRVWYAGFSGEVIGGDSNSPKMSSYVLFSQLVKDTTNIFSCYQANDPTDKDNSDLVDTDGGFLRIQGAYNIVGMVNLGNVLLVFANNGVWSVTGGNSYGFTATNYKVSKITSSGCVSPGSIVVVESNVLYWSRDGIYNISQNQYGDYGANNMTAKTIQKYYNSIPEIIAKYSEGIYDSFEKQVKWVYYNTYGLDKPPTELVMDVNLGAFYKHEIYPYNFGGGTSNAGYPIVVKGIQTNPFSFIYADELVLDASDQVQVGVNDITVSSRTEVSGTKEVVYLILVGPGSEGQFEYSFGAYKDLFHFDWSALFGNVIDAYSYLITGYLSGGDYQRNKQIVYLTVHCERTEVYDTALTNQSSCLAQVQWDWSNDSTSNRWTRQFQTYRLFGPYYPDDSGDKSTKFNVIETRNKVRGTGKVISIMFNSEPGMHLTLYGWSINMGVEGNV